METDFSQASFRLTNSPKSKPDFVQTDTPIIDCDLHNRLPSHQMLYPYLPDYWCDYCEESGFPGPDANDYPEGVPTSTHPEVTHPTENRPASDLALLRKHALDFWEVELRHYSLVGIGYRASTTKTLQRHSPQQSTTGRLNIGSTQNHAYVLR